MSDDATLRKLYQQQQATEQAAKQAAEEAKRAQIAASEERFRRDLESELSEDVRRSLGLRISDFKATFIKKGVTFNITWYEHKVASRLYGASPFDKETVRDWSIWAIDSNTGLIIRNTLQTSCSYGSLQSYLIDYLGRNGYI